MTDIGASPGEEKASAPPGRPELRNHGSRVRRLGLLALVGAMAVGGGLAYRARELPKLAEMRRRQQIADELALREAAVQARPGDVQARWALANVLWRLGQVEGVETHLRALLKIDPGHREARLALSRMLTLNRRFEDALKENEEIARRWPDDEAGYAGAAICYRQLYELAPALQMARRAMQHSKDPVNSRLLAGALAVEYAEQGPTREARIPFYGLAVRTLREVVKADPQHSEGHFRLGRAYQGLQQDDKALEHYRKAVELNPKSADALESLTRLALSAGHVGEAEQTAAKLVASHPEDARGHYFFGHILLKKGDPKVLPQATQALLDAARLDPREPAYLERLGTALQQANRLPDARDAFMKAMRLNPERVFPYQQLAAIYTRLGDTRNATLAARDADHLNRNEQQLKYLQQQSALRPRDVKLHLILADRYRELKRFTHARDEYRAALILQPGNKQAEAALKRVVDELRRAEGVP